jgi:hypothetical protein
MFDINKVIATADLPALVSKAGGELKNNHCACPLHGGANKTGFSVFSKDGKDRWICFSGDCGQGDAIDFVRVWQGLDFKGAIAFLGGDVVSDPAAMEASARARHEAAEREMIAAQEKEQARRKELQEAERHLYYHEQLKTSRWMRDTWTSWGIDEGMQDFWQLGGCNDFFVDGEYHSPTLTIPVVNSEYELMTIRHRIINPINHKDKYRPDRAGLRSHPFLAMPPMGFDGGIIWVMEGEKKAMVTWTQADSDWQCIGVPGQEMYKHLIDDLKPVGQRVIVVPDPNAETKAIQLAKAIGGSILLLPEKIDDFILSTGATQNDLYKMSKQTRKP